VDAEAPIGLARELLDHQIEVGVVEDGPPPLTNDEHSVFFTTYNRTQLQLQVRDLINICTAAKTLDFKTYRVVLCGEGQGAFWSLLAAPAADAVIANCGQLDLSDDQNLLPTGLFCPGIRNIDTFTGAAILAAPHPLLLHNLSEKFPTENLRTSYQTLNTLEKFKTDTKALPTKAIFAWLNSLDH
jgi:hypothetical protein